MFSFYYDVLKPLHAWVSLYSFILRYLSYLILSYVLYTLSFSNPKNIFISLEITYFKYTYADRQSLNQTETKKQTLTNTRKQNTPMHKNKSKQSCVLSFKLVHCILK